MVPVLFVSLNHRLSANNLVKPGMGFAEGPISFEEAAVPKSLNYVLSSVVIDQDRLPAPRFSPFVRPTAAKVHAGLQGKDRKRSPTFQGRVLVWFSYVPPIKRLGRTSQLQLRCVSLLRRFDIADWGQPEKSAVLSTELAQVPVTDFVRSGRSIQSVHQHPLTRGL